MRAARAAEWFLAVAGWLARVLAGWRAAGGDLGFQAPPRMARRPNSKPCLTDVTGALSRMRTLRGRAVGGFGQWRQGQQSWPTLQAIG